MIALHPVAGFVFAFTVNGGDAGSDPPSSAPHAEELLERENAVPPKVAPVPGAASSTALTVTPARAAEA